MVKSSVFRARDVRANIIEMGFEKGIELSLTLLADELAGIRQTLTDLTQNAEKMIDLIASMTVVNGEIAQTIDTMKRREDQFNESRGQGIIPSRY